jgi:hypothetical protein
MSVETFALALVLSSSWMAAIGWYVGLVHYPAFLSIERARWQSFHRLHTGWTGPLVGPPMLLQIAATATLTFLQVPLWWNALSVAALLLSVGWTAAVSGPIHGKIATLADEKLIRRLIRTNHVRAVAWTAHAALAVYLLLTV